MWGYPDALRWGTMAMKVEIFCFVCFFAKDRAKEPQSSLSIVINIDLVSEVGRSNWTPSEKPDYFVLRSMSRLFNPNDFKSG